MIEAAAAATPDGKRCPFTSGKLPQRSEAAGDRSAAIQKLVTPTTRSAPQCLFPQPANGADHILVHSTDDSVLTANGLVPHHYVLALGNISVNKNIRVVAEVVAKLKGSNLRLVVAGARSAKLFSDYGLGDYPRTSVLGYISDGAIRALYEQALCFVFPSLYEGFGIPPLEAMLCGCPVIVSDIPALRETCGDAALYCDPRDPDGLAAHISMLANDPELQARLRDTGWAQSRAFTWDRAAEMLLKTMREVLDTGTRRAGWGARSRTPRSDGRTS